MQQIEWSFRAMRCFGGKPDPSRRGVLTSYVDLSSPSYAVCIQFIEDHSDEEPWNFRTHLDFDDVPVLNQIVIFGDTEFVPYGLLPVPNKPDVEVVTKVVSIKTKRKAQV